MDQKLLYYYLLILYKNGINNDISKLTDIFGAKRMDVNATHRYAYSEGYIIKTENGYVLTEKGSLEMKTLRSKLKIKGSERFIMPYNSSRTPKISTKTVYIPK